MVHSNTGITETNWNPDGPKNAPDSWPAKFKYPPRICHDSTRPPEAQGTCDVPLYKLESDCRAGRGRWIPHHMWNPGEPPCCGGFNYDGTEQGPCLCGPGTNMPCEDCPHDCRVVIGRYPFISSTNTPGYLDPIFGCSTEEYCKRADDVYPWITGGCDCCGPCCPSMIGVRHTYEHESWATLDMGHCYPLFTHKGFTDQTSCESSAINGVRGTWVLTDEDIPTPQPVAGVIPDGVCFETGPVLGQGQVLLPGGSRVQTGAIDEAACNPGVWVPIITINGSPPGCIAPNKCSDNCGGSQVGVCHEGAANGNIMWGTNKGDCASPNVWSEDACNTQAPCCEKRGAQLYVKEGYEKLKAQISGCSCPGGGVCETDLVWLGGAGLPISISPWEKFGGIDPYKEVFISIEGVAGPRLPGQGVGDFTHINSLNIESTCGIWGGTFGTCDGCGQYVALYDVDCPGCGYTSHPIGPSYPDTEHQPPHSPGTSNAAYEPECKDFPAVQPAPACVYTLKELLPGKIDCYKCCTQNDGPPHGDCSGYCESATEIGVTIPSSGGFDCAGKGGEWKLNCESNAPQSVGAGAGAGGTGGTGPAPGLGDPTGTGTGTDSPGQGGGAEEQDCGINCSNPSGGLYRCNCVDSSEMAALYGLPLCRTVQTECGDTKCTMDAWAAPGTCCDWTTVGGDCASQQIVNRGQRCGKGVLATDCQCCEACPACIVDRYGDMTEADDTFDRDAGSFGDWCPVEEEGSGCNLDVGVCGTSALCHSDIKCNGESPMGKGKGARCRCPHETCPPPVDECPYYPCNVGCDPEGDLIKNAIAACMPPGCLCGGSIGGVVWHPGHPPKSMISGKPACKVYCDSGGSPYWASQPCPNAIGYPPSGPGTGDEEEPEAPGIGPDGVGSQDPGVDLPGQGDDPAGGGASGGGGGIEVNECAGCGDIWPRIISDCSFPDICGCGVSNWGGRCEDVCAPSTGTVQTVYLVCHQEAACKEDCDSLGTSREWRGDCHRDRCGAKRGGNLCVDESSAYWPADPPHAGNDGKFRWADNPAAKGSRTPSYPSWGDESECPCGALDDPMELKCGCPGALTHGQIECKGATGRCGGGPHLDGVAPGGTNCQNHWKGTDRYACGHEWFTPPWGWPAVCGGGCGTQDFDLDTKFYGQLTESSEAGVCQWPGPPPVDPTMLNCLNTGTPPLQQDDMIELSSPFGTAKDCVGDLEKDGRCSCNPGDWGSYSTKTACLEDDKNWVTNTWVNTNGVCWHRAGHRVFRDVRGDLITDEATCLNEGSCGDPSCVGCGISACAAKWSVMWRGQNDPYWHDTVFAIANQDDPFAAAQAGNPYPPFVSLLEYKYGGLGDSCYDGCMCGSAEPTCDAGGGCPDMPNCLGACFSCEGNEWDITEAACRAKVADCEEGTDSGGPTQTGGVGDIDVEGSTGSGYDPSAGGTGGTGGSGSGGGGDADSGSNYDWKPNPFAPQGCFVPDEICKGCLTCQGNNADVCGGCGGKACAASGASGQRPHCLSQEWCDEFPKVGKCTGKCPSFGCTGGGCGNYNPWNWKHRRCGKTCNQFHIIFNGATYKAGYEDGAIKHLSIPNCRLFAPDSCCPDTIYLEGEERPAPFIRIAQIDVEDYGEGYTIAPTVTIDDPTFVVLPAGIKATATSYLDKDETSADYGKLTKISITNKGLGYADPDAAAPDPTTISVTLSNGCAHIDANGSPNAEKCGVCGAAEHKTKTGCLNNVGNCTDTNGDEVPEHRNLAACEVAGSGRTWVSTPDSWTPMRQGSLSLRLEAWTGDCERETIVDKDQIFKNNAACGCIAFNDCIPGDTPDADKNHRYEDYICDDIIMTSWEKLEQEVKTGNIIHIWKATNPKQLKKDPDELGEFMSMASSINGDYEIERMSGDYSIKLLCSGREVSAFQPECQAGWCENCADGCPDPDACPGQFSDCCKTGKSGPSMARCEGRRFTNSHGLEDGGCAGEWEEGTCGEQLPNCPTCDARGKCLNNGKCKDVNGDRNIHHGKCRGNPAHDAENCTDPSLTLQENITQCKDNCLEDSEDNCWDGAEGCVEECCGCYDCDYSAVGLNCPACCWDVDAGGHLSPCDGGCSDQFYRTKVTCEANNEIWKEGTECPNSTHPNGPCPQRREDCCSTQCKVDNIVKDLDVALMSFPLHPNTGYSICANPNHSDFGGPDSLPDRGTPACQPCSAVLNGDWDAGAGVCRDIPTRKVRCGRYDHLPGGQETEWESGCCEEQDCEADTCDLEGSTRGDCCGLWSTSACSCPSNYKDCDGNIKKDANNDPIRRPFILDLAINGGSGGCCTTTDMITGLIPGTYNNISSFPQVQSRIIITEV